MELTKYRKGNLEELEGGEGDKATDKMELLDEEVTVLRISERSLQVACGEASLKS